ncbi:putative uncharacterized protein [Firmicutes bacterium CAG:822]|nr:putative uncharacterized protein [Firmicutes bacterium CAG:822]
MQFLIPANTKKSMLIFGAFTTFDLILFAVGIGATLLMLVIISPNTLLTAIIDLLPALICGFLVLPIPNYHNIRIVIQELYRFYTTRQRFIWKGWCVNDEYGESKQVHK